MVKFGRCDAYGQIIDLIVGRTGNIWTNKIFEDGAVVAPE
jgi:hypothetical protein